MLELGDALPAMTLLDSSDREVRLASLHADAPLVAIFLRHFG
jgi:peroxiredoxin